MEKILEQRITELEKKLAELERRAQAQPVINIEEVVKTLVQKLATSNVRIPSIAQIKPKVEIKTFPDGTKIASRID